MTEFPFFCLADEDGREEKKLTFTELCPHLEWCLILKGDDLIGPNLEQWLGYIRKLMIA